MSEQRILRSFPPELEWDNDCDIVVRVWSDEPTPEEIKANHGTCETCEYGVNYHCDNPDSFAYGAVFSYPSIAYCNHHEPKEE